MLSLNFLAYDACSIMYRNANFSDGALRSPPGDCLNMKAPAPIRNARPSRDMPHRPVSNRLQNRRSIAKLVLRSSASKLSGSTLLLRFPSGAVTLPHCGLSSLLEPITWLRGIDFFRRATRQLIALLRTACGVQIHINTPSARERPFALWTVLAERNVDVNVKVNITWLELVWREVPSIFTKGSFVRLASLKFFG